jgi:hypothetical protein
MNIGIIVYSQTGNTYSVALRLQEKLAATGHVATLERIEVVEVAPAKPVQFKTLPDAGPYDALIFGAPVHGFVPANARLSQAGRLAAGQEGCLPGDAGFPLSLAGRKPRHPPDEQTLRIQRGDGLWYGSCKLDEPAPGATDR